MTVIRYCGKLFKSSCELKQHLCLHDYGLHQHKCNVQNVLHGMTNSKDTSVDVICHMCCLFTELSNCKVAARAQSGTLNHMPM